MRNKKGISLIVLVITIIVMVILAASVVITLSNTGIIDRANHAVQLTDEKQVQDLAAMLWAETYLDPSKKDDIENVVKQELAEQGITEDKWNIEISNTGIVITAKGNETDDNQGSDSGNNIVVNVTSSTLSEDDFELESYDPETITFTITTQLEKSVENEKVKLKYSFYDLSSSGEYTHLSDEDVEIETTDKTIATEKSLIVQEEQNIRVCLQVLDMSNRELATYNIDTYKLSNGATYSLSAYAICVPAGTLILVEVEEEDENGNKKKRRKQKKIEDLTYDDNIVVWDFDNGCFSTAKPIWLKKTEFADEYNELTFSNGSVLRTIREHRIFNKELGKFTYPMGEETNIGTTTFTADGEEVKLVNRRVVDEKIDYYNVITNYHINAFADGILTSCRLSNLYDIKDMKYVKDDREIVGIDKFKDIPEEYYYGLRLGEQRRDVNNKGDFSDLKSWTEYVNRLISKKK
ncbi:MAG: hypothetical protein IKL08_00875 [Clostridia bacterium]|nr:hypothetical protein [Clostridia bacterium]